MSAVTLLKCMKCGREYLPSEGLYVCSGCGNEGVLEVLYDYDRIKSGLSRASLSSDSDASMWRYLALLPVQARPAALTLQIGWSPLYASRRIGPLLNLDHVWIKDDGRNPTGSLKDRASAIAVARAVELGATTVAAASTGNAGSSLAGLAANAGLRAYVFVPRTAPPGKIAQLIVFGCHLFLVDGSYDAAFDLCTEASRRFGWYNRNTAFNPYMVEGKKTVALEIAEQLGFAVPDKILVPVGDGCIISAVAKGFRDLRSLGITSRVPQLVAVQAEGCSTIARAVETGEPVAYLPEPCSCADSIVAGVPRNHLMAVRDIRESGGLAVTVSDDEILEAIGLLGRSEGVFAEPAAAASVAGLQKLAARGALDRSERIVILVTGNGLKDIRSALRVPGTTASVAPSLSAVEELVAAGF